VAASAAVARARAAGARGDRRGVRRGLSATLGAGALFLAVQVTTWSRLSAAGVGPSAGIVASVVYALTLFHAAHVLAALSATVPALVRATARLPDGARGGAASAPARAVSRALASLWHFVTAAWLVVFVTVFLT
jgi:heme/copper-type cytochrome/quinol oxidase subunit 3